MKQLKKTIKKTANKSRDNGHKNSAENLDTDCEASDGNDIQISDDFNEETEKRQSKDNRNNEYNCSECQSKFKHKLSPQSSHKTDS